MLRQFHFIDQNGKDQGINVRNRAKELAELLGDVERIRGERKKARVTKNKYTGAEGGMGMGGFSSGGSSRFGGFGNESSYGGGGASADYGGYSGGVYGDGGGFGGQASDFRDTQNRSERFEEYDEYDEGARPAASSSRPARSSARSPAKKETAPPPKQKEPEVDLFSFDEPAAAAPATASSSSGLSGFAPLNTAAAPANDDDDEFDDFQEAAPSGPAAQPLAPSGGFSQPLSPTSPTSPTYSNLAAPKPLSAPQQAGISQMVSIASISPAGSTNATPAAGNSAFSIPVQPAKPAGFQPTGPNYFGNVQAQPTGGSVSSQTPTAGLQPTNKPNGKAAASGGGDAFGALWGKASVGIKKPSTPTTGPALGQLAKEKSSASIWGAPAANPSSAPQGGSASGDLLG
jgi:epsin